MALPFITNLQSSSAAWPVPKVVRASAVVMLFVPPAPGSRDDRLVFIRRSSDFGSHRGQIGFPGGRADPDDRSPIDTGLRELSEELGVAPHDVAVHGTLSAIPSLDGAPVITVVASTKIDPSAFVACPTEVAAILTAPWTAFAADKMHTFRFNLFGNWRSSHLFEAPGFTVWGLTAGIIARATLQSP